MRRPQDLIHGLHLSPSDVAYVTLGRIERDSHIGLTGDRGPTKVQSLPTNIFSNGLTQVRTGVDQFGRDVSRDSWKISMCGIKKSPVFDPRVSSSSARLVVPSSSAVSRSLVLSVLSLFVTHRWDPRTRTGPTFLPELIHSPALQRC